VDRNGRSRNRRLDRPAGNSRMRSARELGGDFVVPVGLEERTGDDVRLWAAGVTALAALAAMMATASEPPGAAWKVPPSTPEQQQAAQDRCRQGDARDILGSRRRPRTLQPSVGRHDDFVSVPARRFHR
jgi:hypothetical protein